MQGVLLFGLNQSTPKSGMSKKSNYRQLLCYIQVHKIIRVKLWQTAFSIKTCIQLVCLHGEYCALSSDDQERDGYIRGGHRNWLHYSSLDSSKVLFKISWYKVKYGPSNQKISFAMAKAWSRGGYWRRLGALKLLSGGWCLKIEIVISYSIRKYLIEI